VSVEKSVPARDVLCERPAGNNVWISVAEQRQHLLSCVDGPAIPADSIVSALFGELQISGTIKR